MVGCFVLGWVGGWVAWFGWVVESGDGLGCWVGLGGELGWFGWVVGSRGLVGWLSRVMGWGVGVLGCWVGCWVAGRFGVGLGVGWLGGKYRGVRSFRFCKSFSLFLFVAFLL